MEYTIIELPERHLIGSTTQTSNDDPDCSQKIGTLWQKFMADGMEKSIPEAIIEPYSCYAVYYDYNFTNMGYTTLVGCESSAPTAPEGAEMFTLPAGKYAKFVVHGNVVQAVIKAWDEIWCMEELTPLRAYTVDFEAYLPMSNPQDATIELYVALK